jgi:hypothetical protein
MKHFTPEDNGPTEATLHIIRQIAYRYRAMKTDGNTLPMCMN